MPRADEVPGLTKALAERAGRDANDVANLLRAFASADRGNICTWNARCTECQVHFCKRLRYR